MDNKIKIGKVLLYLVVGLSFLISSACQDEKQKNDYSGMSRLINERNKARYSNYSKTSPSKKNTVEEKTDNKPIEEDSSKKELLSVSLYKENVKIISSKSGQLLSKGVAYINKKGQIVKIKLVKK